jgi:hypothetical protein
MFGNSFYHQSLRRYVTIFGTLFNEILISREDSSNVTQKNFRVPIAYGPMQKFLARIEGDPNLNNQVAVTLPRISFEITNIAYDPERRLTGLIRNTKTSSANDNILLSQFAPAPYNIDFTLTIMAKYSEDGTKIVEQILPFFKPEWTTSVKLVDDLNEYFDIPTILTSVNNEEVYEGDFSTRRAVLWSLTFTMKGYFFGPTSNKKIIKFANVNFYSNISSNTINNSVKVYPGLTVDGEPAGYVSTQVVNATATAIVENNSVTGLTIVNNGKGYKTATVTIAPPATISNTEGIAVLNSGSLASVSLSTLGFGHLNAPTITIGAPQEGSNTATASATISNGVITAVNVTHAGSGYTSTPAVTFTAPDGNNASFSATATANVQSGAIRELTVVTGGVSYSSEPVVTISVPDDVSVDHSLINKDDDYGYVIIITDS